jgi:hypothetical protein
MAKSTKAVITETNLFLVEGGINLKFLMSDGTTVRPGFIAFGNAKEFTFDRKKGSIVKAATTGGKFGDRGFLFTLGKVSYKLFPQAKGHFFGTPVADHGPASSYDDFLAATA